MLRVIRFVVMLGLLYPAGSLRAQTPEEVDKLIKSVIELDSIDLAREVKFRAGLMPALDAVDADESAMTVLKDPYEPQGKDTPGAFGWYRIHFTVPERLGEFSLKENPGPVGIDVHVQGSWESYYYKNGVPAGANKGVLIPFNQVRSESVGTASLLAKPGDQVTVAVLAWGMPLAKGSPDGFSLRHLRLRFTRHTNFRSELLGGGRYGLYGARQKLATLQGEPLQAFQARLNVALQGLNEVFRSVESGRLEDLMPAMKNAAAPINAILED